MKLKKFSPTILIQEDDFHNAYARAVRAVLRDGKEMTIGDETEPKPIKDACVLFELTDGAIKQIENREVHPDFPFQGKQIDVYCKEYERDAVVAWQEADPKTRFAYMYVDRLINPIDQLQILRKQLAEQIRTGISSNRSQGVTWMCEIDADNSSPPCLQRCWIRYLGNQDVEVHLTWRSRDLFHAWQSNIIAIIDMLNREIIHPNGCRIVKLIDYADSLHVYLHSAGLAAEVKPLPVSPQRAQQR